MKEIPIRLTMTEMTMGAECGVLRQINSFGRKSGHGLVEKDGGWGKHINGACGEVAVAKGTGRYWARTVNTFHAPDIEPDIQVRTRLDHGYELNIRADDNPTHRYVLVTGLAPDFVVRGYILGSDARRDEWVKAHGGRPEAWFVPQAALRDPHELILRDWW